MDLYTPAQLGSLTGLSVASQSAWRVNGLMKDRGTQTKGGHWRFHARDVLYIAAVRFLAEENGIGLSVAGMLANSFFLEIEGEVTGVPRIISEHYKYAFAWKRKNCTPAAEAALPQGEFPFDEWIDNKATENGLIIHQTNEWCAVIINDLEFIPRLSKAGGIIVVPKEIGQNIPPAVADLFKASAKK